MVVYREYLSSGPLTPAGYEHLSPQRIQIGFRTMTDSHVACMYRYVNERLHVRHDK